MIKNHMWGGGSFVDFDFEVSRKVLWCFGALVVLWCFGAIGALMNRVLQPRPLVVLGLNVWMDRCGPLGASVLFRSFMVVYAGHESQIFSKVANVYFHHCFT